MSTEAEFKVEIAGPDDADVIGRLLHEFNREYDEPTPDPPAIAERIRELLAGDETTVLLGRPEPSGIAVLRFRPSIWVNALESYLAELYVVPALRGQGLGTALLETAMRVASDKGATFMDLNTSEGDVAARHLYEKFGFTNREGGPDGPIEYYYERDL